MEWKMLFNADENILFVKTYGVFDLGSKITLIKEFVLESEKQNCRQCLIDNSELWSTRIKFMEIYSLLEKFTELNVPRHVLIAEVVLEKYKKDFDFLETICHNRGYQVSAFSDIESALQWLKKSICVVR
jgi:hypothetical protein